MERQDSDHNFDYYDSIYKEHIKQNHQEVKEICVNQDLIDLYTEYIAELDEFFNYPNSRGE